MKFSESEKAMFKESERVFYMIVYHRGDRSKIGVATVQNFDVPHYDLASEKEFDTEKEAVEYAKNLARTNNKEYVGDDRDTAILD